MGTVLLHVVPRARETAVGGFHGNAVKIRIAAPPVDGAANAELVRFLAARLGVPATRVSITGGTRGRRKTLAVARMDADQIRRALLDTSAGVPE